MTDGTVLITGGNGSLALEFASILLSNHPSYTLLATVRNPSPEADRNTARLSSIISSHPSSRGFIEALDHSSLSAVRSFASSLASRISSGEIPPISAIVCNALHWSLHGAQFTRDGYESTMQVALLAHYLLVMKLLGVMKKDARIVFLGSVTHDPEAKNPLSKLNAEWPGDSMEEMEKWVKPERDQEGWEHDRGFQRMGNAKLGLVMVMEGLNRRLQMDPKLSDITVTTMDPGGLVDSRAHQEQKSMVRVVMTVISVLMPVLKYLPSDQRTSRDSAGDLVQLAVGESFQEKRGYFFGTMLRDPAKIAKDMDKQDKLWEAVWRWTGMKEEETALRRL